MAKKSPRVAERDTFGRRSPRAEEARAASRSKAGKNPTPRQIETSMSKKYKGTPKVSSRTITKIKTLGMSAALKEGATNKNPEFREGLRRMYGAKRVSQAFKSAKPKAPKAVANRKSPRASERAASATVTNRKSPRAVEKKSSSSRTNRLKSDYGMDY